MTASHRLLVVSLVCLAAARAGAESECPRLPPDTTVTAHTYRKVPYTAEDMLCDPPAGDRSGRCALRGLLFVPDGARHAPAVIFNHGAKNSDKKEDSFLCMARYFLRHGFVVFLPLRRGYSMTGPDITGTLQSTGKFQSDVMAELELWRGSDVHPFPREALPYWPACVQDGTWAGAKDCVNAALVRAETAEVGAAVHWLKGRTVGSAEMESPLVDPARVAIMGHSGGAKTSIFSAADLSGDQLPAVAISLSMAESGRFGKNDYMDAGLESAAENALIPVAFFQPANALDLGSTRILGRKAAGNRRRYLAQVFPPIPVEPDKVHNAFLTREDQVDAWGPVARRYMAIYGVE
jgi:dienelactone hydrolase